MVRVGVQSVNSDTLADMVIVDGDPIDDVCVLQDHNRLTVIKGGQAA